MNQSLRELVDSRDRYVYASPISVATGCVRRAMTENEVVALPSAPEDDEDASSPELGPHAQALSAAFSTRSELTPDSPTWHPPRAASPFALDSATQPFEGRGPCARASCWRPPW